MPPPSGGGSLKAVKYGTNSNAIAAPIPVEGATKIVITVHGGWWSEEQEPYVVGEVPPIYNNGSVLADLAAHGFAVFDVNYQLAKGITNNGSNPTSYPEQNTEVKEAVEYVISNWKELGFPNPSLPGNGIFLLGGSAGGNLALLAAQEVCKAKPGCLRGVISLSGACDLPTWAESLYGTGATAFDRLCSTSNCATHAEPLEPACKAKMAERSPINKIDKTTDPPYYIEGAPREGTKVDLVPWETNGKRMVEALEAAGANVHSFTVTGGVHAFKAWSKCSADVYAWMALHG